VIAAKSSHFFEMAEDPVTPAKYVLKMERSVDIPLEVNGRWWLPEKPDYKVKGTLRISEHGDSVLTLLGGLRQVEEWAERTEHEGGVTYGVSEELMRSSGVYRRILGTDGLVAFTLEDCLQFRRTNVLLPEYGLELIRANQVFRGVWFEPEERIAGTGISFALDLLQDWLMESGLRQKWNAATDGNLNSPLPDGVPRFELEAMTIGNRDLMIGNQKLTLKHSVGTSGGRLGELSLTEEFYWKINSPELVELSSLLRTAGNVQDLVSIGTNRRAAFRNVSLLHPDVYWESDSDRAPKPIQVFAHWNVQPVIRKRLLVEEEMFFSFVQFGGIDGTQRWMEAASRHQRALGRAMATHYSKSMYVSDRLLNCCAALEAFDRTLNGFENSKFTSRLKRCASYAGPIFGTLVGEISTWLEEVRVERDDAAHNLGTGSTTTRAYYLWKSLYLLFVLCMLNDSGCPDEATRHLEKHQEFRLVQKRLSARQGKA